MPKYGHARRFHCVQSLDEQSGVCVSFARSVSGKLVTPTALLAYLKFYFGRACSYLSKHTVIPVQFYEYCNP